MDDFQACSWHEPGAVDACIVAVLEDAGSDVRLFLKCIPPRCSFLQVHLAQLCCRWHFDVRDWNVSGSCAINPEKENLPYTMYVLRVLANLYKNLKQNYQILSLKLKNLTLNRFPSKG